MRTITLKCPEELYIEIQKLTHELNSENAVIDRYLDRHSNEPEALEAPIFIKYQKSVIEKNATLELLKDKITQELLTPVKDHNAYWELNFADGLITVNIMCDCEIEWPDVL